MLISTQRHIAFSSIQWLGIFSRHALLTCMYKHFVRNMHPESQPKHEITSIFKPKSQTAGSELRHQQAAKSLHEGPYYDTSLLQKQIPLLPLPPLHFLNNKPSFNSTHSFHLSLSQSRGPFGLQAFFTFSFGIISSVMPSNRISQSCPCPPKLYCSKRILSSF